MMYVRAGMVRDQTMNEFHAVNNHDDLGHILENAGFMLPDNDGEPTNLSGGLRVMLDKVSSVVGYDPRIVGIETRGERHRGFIDFYAAGGGKVVDFRAAGLISASAGSATETALYRGLLTVSVNRRVEVNDTNRGAYQFAKERVAQVSADIVSLGNSGSSICSYFDSTRRGLDLLMNSYSTTLRRHPSGEQLCRRLEALAAEVNQCLIGITEPVRSMNENSVVALGPF